MSAAAASTRPHAVGHSGSDPMERATRLMTAEQLADRWQVSKAQIYRLAREGRIPAVPIGRYYRFRLDAIAAWEEGAADV